MARTTKTRTTRAALLDRLFALACDEHDAQNAIDALIRQMAGKLDRAAFEERQEDARKTYMEARVTKILASGGAVTKALREKAQTILALKSLRTSGEHPNAGQPGVRTAEQQAAYMTAAKNWGRLLDRAGIPNAKGSEKKKDAAKARAQAKAKVAKGTKTTAKPAPVAPKVQTRAQAVAYVVQEAGNMHLFLERNAKMLPADVRALIEEFRAKVMALPTEAPATK